VVRLPIAFMITSAVVVANEAGKALPPGGISGRNARGVRGRTFPTISTYWTSGRRRGARIQGGRMTCRVARSVLSWGVSVSPVCTMTTDVT